MYIYVRGSNESTKCKLLYISQLLIKSFPIEIFSDGIQLLQTLFKCRNMLSATLWKSGLYRCEWHGKWFHFGDNNTIMIIAIITIPNIIRHPAPHNKPILVSFIQSTIDIIDWLKWLNNTIFAYTQNSELKTHQPVQQEL